MLVLHSKIHTEESCSALYAIARKRNFNAPAYIRDYTLITLSAFSFAAVNYQLSIVSTHFVQRQQTSTYGMISYKHLLIFPVDFHGYLISVCCIILLTTFAFLIAIITQLLNAIPYYENNCCV